MSKTIVLDATNKSITAVLAGAVATTQPDFMFFYADATASAFTEAGADGTLNSTTPVTLVAAPAASTRRVVRDWIIDNRDTAAVTITINYVDGAATRRLWYGTLQPDERITGDGTYDASGNLKTVLATIPAHGHTDSTSGGQLDAGNVFSAGQMPLARGGTHADLSATGPGMLVQASAAADISILASGSARQVAQSDGTKWVSAGLAAQLDGSTKVAAFDLLNFKDLNVEDLTNGDVGIWLNLPGVVGGRLTLTTGVPVTTSNVTGAGTLYYTPYIHDKIALFDGTRWKVYTFAEVSLSLTLTSGNVYDVFLYDNAGTLTLETLAWTNTTTRATALVQQNGVWCKTGALTRRWLGTLQASGTNTAEDSNSKRLLQNYYNRVPFRDYRGDTTDSWTTNGNGTWSAINGGNAAWKHEFVIGIDEHPMKATALLSSDVDYLSAIAVDSTNTIDRTKTTIALNRSTGSYITNVTQFNAFVGIGAHYLQGVQTSRDTPSATAYGDNGGVIGSGSIGPQSGFVVEGWR